MPTRSSNFLREFSKSMLKSRAEEEQEALWCSVKNPIIEDIPGQTEV